MCSSARSISQLKRRSLRSLSDPVHPSILFGSLVDELGGAADALRLRAASDVFCPPFCEGAETEMADVLPDGWGAYQDDQGWAGPPIAPSVWVSLRLSVQIHIDDSTTYTVMMKEVHEGRRTLQTQLLYSFFAFIHAS